MIAFENISLDGYMAGPNGELDWAMRDDEVADYAQEGQSAVETFVFGRVTYEMMAGFWPTPAGEAASPVFANALKSIPKIVFSTTLDRADWQHSEIVRELTTDTVLKLKQMPGGNMMIFGSGTIVNQLAVLGLMDEYQLMVNPIVLGKGKPLFTDSVDRMPLKLVGTRTFKSGLVLLQYRSPRPE